MSNAAGQEPVTKKHVVIVGGGFVGLNCARKLASHSDVRITLIDKNNYQQFQPLLYQVGLKWGFAIRPQWKANYDTFEGSGVAARRA